MFRIYLKNNEYSLILNVFINHISPHIIKVEFPVENVSNELAETQLEIMQLISDNTMISQNTIAMELNMTVSGVKRAMKRMQRTDIIMRDESYRKGKWIILKKE